MKSECLKRDSSRTLTRVKAGETVVVRDICGGCNARRRMEDMGFLPGERLQVLNASGGPVIVLLRGSRVGLGRGMAEKILVGNG